MLSELNEKDIQELRVIAAKLDIQVHHKAGKDKIIGEIAEKLAAQNKPKQRLDKVVEVKTFHNTEEEVREAIAEHFTKDGFDARFLADNTVIFSFKGVTESCNLDIPLKHIVTAATRVITTSRMKLRAFEDGEFEKLQYTGKAAYAKNVLM